MDLDRLVEETIVPKTLGQLTDSDLIQELQARGHRVELKSPAGEGRIRIEVRVSEVHTSTFAVVSDTHLGSRHQQLTYLHDFYAYAQERGASFVLHSGDMIDGPTQMHRDIIYEQFVHGYDAQVDYAEKAYPDVGLTTYAIMGNHDQSFLQNAGGNPVAELARRRDDIVHIGDLGAMVEVEAMTAYLWHPPGGNAYARCVDPDTEILTVTGWQRFDRLEEGVPVATLNPIGHRFEWQIPTDYTKDWFDGDLLHFKARTFDLMVTPDHRFYTKRYEPLLGRMEQLSYPTKSHRRVDTSWRFVNASDIRGRQTWQMLGTADDWWGTEPEDQHLVNLIGWYVTEGSSQDHGFTIHQYQERNPENYELIVQMGKALGLRFSTYPKGVSFWDTGLARWLERQAGKGWANKQLPTWVKELSRESLRELLDVMIRGDGWVSGRSWGFRSFSPTLMDDVQEIAIKAGYGATLSADGQSLSIRTVQTAPTINNPPELVPYQGYVYCVSVPNGVILVRRNGKVIWTGNSYKLQKFIEQYERGSKPHFVFAGHFHTSGHLPNYQNVSAFNVPCFQAQTPFIRRLGLNPDIGGIVIEVGWEEIDGQLLPVRHKTDWRIYRRPVENDY